MSPQDIARVCHEANRAYCAIHGDRSHECWEDSPDHLQQSVIAGVNAALRDPTLTAHGAHGAWRRHKIAEGWRHGLEKNVDYKTHPNLVPFEELPPFKKTKNVLFLAIVRALV